MAGEMDGLADAYRAPLADGEHEQGRAAHEVTDYVVSPTKLVLLYTATLGLYSVYWFYQHWRHQKLVRSENIWPLPRAIFSVFYVAPLFKQLDLDARLLGHTTTWNPTTHAAIFIVVNVGARVLDKIGGATEGMNALSVLALLLPLLSMFPVLTAQKVVNLSVGDPQGVQNSKLGAGGAVVLLAGSVLWLLIVAGLVLSP